MMDSYNSDIRVILGIIHILLYLLAVIFVKIVSYDYSIQTTEHEIKP